MLLQNDIVFKLKMSDDGVVLTCISNLLKNCNNDDITDEAFVYFSGQRDRYELTDGDVWRFTAKLTYMFINKKGL